MIETGVLFVVLIAIHNKYKLTIKEYRTALSKVLTKDRLAKLAIL